MKSLEYTLLGIENPLLDMIVYCDRTQLDRYQLNENDAILATEQHFSLFQELDLNPETLFVAGGGAQNTLRTTQWMLGGTRDHAPRATVYLGCAGRDGFADRLRQEAHNDGLRTEYLEDPDIQTGTCAVLVHNNHRSMVANLGAANNYRQTHLQRPDIWSFVENARFYYSTGFFLTVSPESLRLIMEHAVLAGKIVCFNLAASFIIQCFGDRLHEVLPYCDFLFGNHCEMIAYAEANHLNSHDIVEIGKYLANYPKTKTERERIIVITQSAQPTLLINSSGLINSYPVLPIDPDEIIDTNGAGDAFVGGFLSQLLLNKNLDTCVKGGHFAANFILKQTGVRFPTDSLFIEEESRDFPSSSS
jgi:adenosine kinase